MTMREPKDGEWWWGKEDDFGPIVAARWDSDEQLDSGGSWFGVADYGSHNLKATDFTPFAPVTTPEADKAKDELIEQLVAVAQENACNCPGVIKCQEFPHTSSNCPHDRARIALEQARAGNSFEEKFHF